MFKKVELVSKTLQTNCLIQESLNEIPLVGRSNVGKSTFLNKILKRKIARVSKTPGRTRSIDFYLIDEKFYIVDLPGFGYAKVGWDLKEKWQKVMANYFKRKSITHVIHLIDSSIPVQKIDLEVSQWISNLGLIEILLFTKTDKVKKTKLKHQLKLLSEKFTIPVEFEKIEFSKNYSENQIFALQEKFYSVLGFE